MRLLSIRHQFIAIMISLVCAWPSAQAQTPQPAATQPDQPLLSEGQLDALVAPVALYPDPLLAQVLMASTYPLEVVQAERWLDDKKQLKEDALKSAAGKEPWDDSVKSLVATPSVLEMMSQQLEWTQKLGNAVLAQQADVMSAVQRLRTKAHDNKKLSSTKEQTVAVRQENGKSIVAVEPTAADVVAVPYYNPAVVYDPWPYTDYPPYYFGVPDYIPGGLIASGLAFGAGYLVGRWADGNYWHGGINWNRGDITINRPIDIHRNRVTHWQHNPQHRGGVQYTNANVRQKFANADIKAGRDARETLRAGTADRGLADRKQAAGKAGAKTAHKGGAKNAAGRTGPAKTAARTKGSAGGAGKAQARARHGKPHAARAHARHAPRVASHHFSPRVASFGGRGGGFGRHGGGGGRAFRRGGGRRR